MEQALDSLQDRVAPAEEIFFTWLIRVFLAATLVDIAWLDDAPPLGLGAALVAFYVALRVASQFRNLFSAAPFEQRVLKAAFAVAALLLLGLSFLTVAIFVERLARSVAG